MADRLAAAYLQFTWTYRDEARFYPHCDGYCIDISCFYDSAWGILKRVWALGDLSVRQMQEQELRAAVSHLLPGKIAHW
jgi:hypothetical protein